MLYNEGKSAEPSAQPEHIALAQQMAVDILDRFDDPIQQNEALSHMHHIVATHRIQTLEMLEKKTAYFKESLDQLGKPAKQ
jgi:hypothetical protein